MKMVAHCRRIITNSITATPLQPIAARGKRLAEAILSADALKQELFYVGASRGRSEIAIVTSDREQLRESLGISSARPSAMELAREQAHVVTPEHSIQHATVQNYEPLQPSSE